ncbi:MAG TPA: DNA adenine methylase [Candidatus Nealsonbacteria bacterium]|uniref:site-specific DNA-methyltransferase (adenine-specific) n=1 Tax=marine sediment metagenome TaxID=412755 RepID=A0A0F9XT96_9ZZZZ|nr:DNA adenine methylase [Candidatus Nealsonbacteria bacterium]HEB46783.1 DNA adenine methylase [Candidatus Nealsonbacteria bacterium]
MEFYSPLRYPGGKTFLADELKRILVAIGLDKPTYVEPYAGGAGVALTLLFDNRVRQIVINDLDKTIYAFWKSVTQNSERFAQKIITTPVTITEWKKQKQIYLNKNANIFEKGFATFFLNRTNRSGVMNAGPIGGKNQDGPYKINMRYNKKKLALRVRKIGKFQDRISVLNKDGIQLTRRYLNRNNTFIYLDPPYFKKGAMLYLNHYKEDDHKKLADLLNTNTNYNWVLTYDEVKKIREFYPDRMRKRLSLKYSVYDSCKIRKARELMIFSDSISRAKTAAR